MRFEAEVNNGECKSCYPVRKGEELKDVGTRKERLAYNRSNLYRRPVACILTGSLTSCSKSFRRTIVGRSLVQRSTAYRESTWSEAAE